MRSKPLLILAAVLLPVLAACATGVSFQNAKLGPDDQNPQRVSGLLFKPEGKGPFPAVVLLPSCGGLKSHVTTDWPNYLTGLGYVAMTVDSLGSRGFVSCGDMPWAEREPRDEFFRDVRRDAYGALYYLASLPDVDKNRIAVMGFSLGAIAINNNLIPALSRPSGGLDFKAAISLYGHCNNLYYYSKDSIPLMEIVGEKDINHAPSCEQTGKFYPILIEVHVLPGAFHGFDDVEASGRYDIVGSYMQYSGSATRKARELTKAFLAKHLGM